MKIVSDMLCCKLDTWEKYSGLSMSPISGECMIFGGKILNKNWMLYLG